MKVDVVNFKDRLPELRLYGCTAIVIDVLRCTTSMINAVGNGAEKVIPTAEPGDAAALASRIGSRECVIGGERGGLKLPGFDVGNSPAEYDRGTVGGKTVIISTTNGTAAICGAKNARRVLLASLINCDAVAKAALRFNDDIMIICAGTDGAVSADDICAAGGVINRLRAHARGVELTDAAMISEYIYDGFKNGSFDLTKTFHYSRLMRLGFKDDVEFCTSEDITDCVPCYHDGIITAFK